MNPVYMPLKPKHLYSPTLTFIQYDMMKETLTSAAFQVKTEADVERWLAKEGRELMRRLIQSHLTLRCQAQAQKPLVGADGVPRTHLRPEKSRKLETV